ncbi:Dimer Tnp hAT domain-containing protein [Aphis craccivora]|uniref:Dimer Tnp hAT domain-containing protein n=1 Tax=Aphis craccivora TaxID=307492 RepID=A0A6G0Y4B8_APHCR|nr:Dimer Tnp hAT domain-containing protein [Aphis craccivora]
MQDYTRDNHTPKDNIVKFSFVLSGSNAAVERVYSLMNSTWTNSRNKLDIKTLEATLIIKTCFNNKSYEVFYDQILGNKSLLKQIHGSANYVVKSTEETLDS